MNPLTVLLQRILAPCTTSLGMHRNLFGELSSENPTLRSQHHPHLFILLHKISFFQPFYVSKGFLRDDRYKLSLRLFLLLFQRKCQFPSTQPFCRQSGFQPESVPHRNQNPQAFLLFPAADPYPFYLSCRNTAAADKSVI